MDRSRRLVSSIRHPIPTSLRFGRWLSIHRTTRHIYELDQTPLRGISLERARNFVVVSTEIEPLYHRRGKEIRVQLSRSWPLILPRTVKSDVPGVHTSQIR